MNTKVLTADKLTKLGSIAEHRKFAGLTYIKGLKLLGYDYFERTAEDENSIAK